jgi:hypothetical protein
VSHLISFLQSNPTVPSQPIRAVQRATADSCDIEPSAHCAGATAADESLTENGVPISRTGYARRLR